MGQLATPVLSQREVGELIDIAAAQGLSLRQAAERLGYWVESLRQLRDGPTTTREDVLRILFEAIRLRLMSKDVAVDEMEAVLKGEAPLRPYLVRLLVNGERSRVCMIGAMIDAAAHQLQSSREEEDPDADAPESTILQPFHA